MRTPREKSHQRVGAAGRPASTIEVIEAQLSPRGQPVLGLYLHVAYHFFMSGFDVVGRGEITPNLIGVLALLATFPGVSQAELARMLRIERATVGPAVSRAITLGFVERTATPGSRRYSLFLTTRGTAMLASLRKRIPTHERIAGARLNVTERRQLRELLRKLLQIPPAS